MISPALRQARANSGLTFRPDSSCVLWLPGQDDAYSATIRDRSGKGNHGTLGGTTGGSAFWVRLSSGLWCLGFDGIDDWVGLTQKTLNPANDFTFEAWINQDTAGLAIYSEGTTAANNPSYLIRLNVAVTVTFYYRNDANTEGAVSSDAFSGSATGAWRRVAVSKSGTTWDFYLDDEKSTKTATIGNFNNLTQAGIGCLMRPTKASWFDGGIALPRIYNRALSAGEILTHFQQERSLFNV